MAEKAGYGNLVHWAKQDLGIATDEEFSISDKRARELLVPVAAEKNAKDRPFMDRPFLTAAGPCPCVSGRRFGICQKEINEVAVEFMRLTEEPDPQMAPLLLAQRGNAGSGSLWQVGCQS